MAGIESAIKYAIGLLGIPALTTTVGMAFSAKSGLETAANTAMSVSAGVQMLPEDNNLSKFLENALVIRKDMKYGKDYAYFTLSSYDGALKKLDSSGNGDLYVIRIGGREYFVFAKNGLDNIQNLKSVLILGHLAKRGGTIDGPRMAEFLKPVADALIAQQDRLKVMERAGVRP